MTQLQNRCICMLFLMFLHFATANTFCAEFEFDNAIIQNNTLSAKINTKVNITFKLKNKSCSNLANTVIQISVWDSKRNVPYPQCQIVRREGLCRDPSEKPTGKCSCLNNDNFIFTITVSESDTTTWIWSTSEKQAETVILFNITNADIIHPMTELTMLNTFFELVTSETTKHTDVSTDINVIATNNTWTREHSDHTILGINREVFIHIAAGAGTGATTICITVCCLIIHRARKRRREERWELDDISLPDLRWTPPRAKPAVRRGYLKNDFTEINNDRIYDWAH